MAACRRSIRRPAIQREFVPPSESLGITYTGSDFRLILAPAIEDRIWSAITVTSIRFRLKRDLPSVSHVRITPDRF